jgi:acetyltransferase
VSGVAGNGVIARRRTPRVRIRPLGPGDRTRYVDFLSTLDAGDLYRRTMGRAGVPDAAAIDALLQDDGRTRIALAAVTAGTEPAILGVARAAVDGDAAEFALIVRSAFKRHGFGRRLLRALLARLRELGVTRVVGHTFADNQPLLALARSEAFAIEPGDDGTTRRVARQLASAEARSVA